MQAQPAFLKELPSAVIELAFYVICWYNRKSEERSDIMKKSDIKELIYNAIEQKQLCRIIFDYNENSYLSFPLIQAVFKCK